MTKAKLKIISGVLALAVVAGGVCSLGYASRNEDGKWFGNGNLSNWHWSDKTSDGESNNVTGNTVIGEGESNGVSLMSTAIPVEDYDEYGIDTQAESAVIITATITPSATTNKTVTWSTNDASGKVKVAPVEDNPMQATVQVLGAFDKQVTITCAANSNSLAKATCTVDYVKAFEYFYEQECDDYIRDYVTIDGLRPRFSTGTVTPTSCIGDVYMTMDSDLHAYLVKNHITVQKEEKVITGVDLLTYTDDVTFDMLFNTTDEEEIEAIWQDIAIYYDSVYVEAPDFDGRYTYGYLHTENVYFYYNGVQVDWQGPTYVTKYDLRADNFYDINVTASDVTLSDGSLVFGANGQVQ